MTRVNPPDCPAAVHDSQLNTSGGGRTQFPVAVVPPTAAAPASASPRRASAGTSTPAQPPPRDAPRAGVDPLCSAAAPDLALGAVADPSSPQPSERQAAVTPDPGAGGADPASGNRMPASPGRGRTRAPANPFAAAMSEAELEEQIRDACKKLGIIRIHVYNSRGTTPGVPDDILIGARGILWRECKTTRGKVTAAQQAMGEALQAAGQDWSVWRPEDWFSGRIRLELMAVSALRIGAA